MLRFWRRFCPAETLFVAFGGSEQDFQRIRHSNRSFIESPRLRTRDHQREKQSYAEVFASACDWLKPQVFRYVHFVEYDHIPLVDDLHPRMISFLEAEKCDLAGFHVAEIDRSSNPHYLNHLADPAFLPFWEKVSIRPQKQVILTMFGTGSFWRREAFEAVASLQEEFPIYLEVFQPTAAHHLGFRVRCFRDQNRFVQNHGDFRNRLAEICRQGAWSAHPVKTFWDRDSADW